MPPKMKNLKRTWTKPSKGNGKEVKGNGNGKDKVSYDPLPPGALLWARLPTELLY